MSLMIARSPSPDRRMVSAYSRCIPVSSVSSSSPVMPITPFIGVRISWLMVARNSDFARFAASAAISFCLRALISRTIVSSPSGRPALSRSGVVATDTSTSCPALVFAEASNDVAPSWTAEASRPFPPGLSQRSSSLSGRPIVSADL